MKNTLYVLIVVLILFGCKKKNDNDNNNNNNYQGGKLALNMTYSLGQKKLSETGIKSLSEIQETHYTQFGNYIGSITPTVLIGKFLDMRIQSWTAGSNMWNTNLNLIDNNTALDSSNRLADFSNNAVVSFNPNTSEVPNNQDVVFNIFVFIPLFFYQEFTLPVEYTSVTNLQYLNFGGTTINFDGFAIGGDRNGLFVKGSYEPFLASIFDSTWTGFNGSFPQGPKTYVFGDSDSTYMYYSSISGQVAQSIDNPLGQGGYIIRSNAYSPITIQAPTNGETTTYNGSMTFNINNLIQIYAGNDNIAYTQDDIFVYAPKFWERLSVNIAPN